MERVEGVEKVESEDEAEEGVGGEEEEERGEEESILLEAAEGGVSGPLELEPTVWFWVRGGVGSNFVNDHDVLFELSRG